MTVDDILSLTKGSQRYQFRVLAVMFILGYIVDFAFNEMPLLETLPIVDFSTGAENITTQVNYTICKRFNFTVNETLTRTYSWVYEYDIYCDKLKVSLLGASMVAGSLVGTVISQFSNIYGTRAVMIFGAFVFLVGSLTLAFHMYKALLLGNFLLGVSHGIIFITKNIILTEISLVESRAIFLCISISTASLANILAYTYVWRNINWRIYYSLHGFICLATVVYYISFSVENPRFHLVKGNYDKFKASILYIWKFNQIDHQTYNRESKVWSFIRRIYNTSDSTRQSSNSISTREEISRKIDSIYDKKYGLRLNDMSTRPVYELECKLKPTQSLLDNDDDRSEYFFTNMIITPQPPVVRTSRMTLFTISLKSNINSLLVRIHNREFYLFAVLISIEQAFLFLNSLEIKQYNNYMDEAFYIYACLHIVSNFKVALMMDYFGRKGALYFVITVILSTILLKCVFSRRVFLMVLYLVKRNYVQNLLGPVHTFANESFDSRNRVLLYGLGYCISKCITCLMPFVYEYLMGLLDALGFGFCLILYASLYFTNETVNRKLLDH